MNQELQNVSWNTVLKSGNVEEKWNAFQKKLENIINKHVPSKCIKKSSDPLWMNGFIKRLQRKKTRLYKRMKQTGCESDISPVWANCVIV